MIWLEERFIQKREFKISRKQKEIDTMCILGDEAFTSSGE